MAEFAVSAYKFSCFSEAGLFFLLLPVDKESVLSTLSTSHPGLIWASEVIPDLGNSSLDNWNILHEWQWSSQLSIYLHSAKTQQKLYYDTLHKEQVKSNLFIYRDPTFLHGEPRGNHQEQAPWQLWQEKLPFKGFICNILHINISKIKYALCEYILDK